MSSLSTPPSAPPTPPKKSNRGCLIAFLVAAGLVTLLVAAGAVVAYRFAQSPEGQEAMALLKETTSMAADAMKAPGTKELRELGCDTALVMDMARLGAFAKQMGEAEVEQVGESFGHMVTC